MRAAARGTQAARARDALAASQPRRARSRSRRRSSASPPARTALGDGATRACSREPTARPTTSCSTRFEPGNVPPGARGARRRDGRARSRPSTSSRSPRERGRAPIEVVTAVLLPPRQPARAALAARPHDRAAALEPLAGPRPRRAARRSRRAAARADARGPRGRAAGAPGRSRRSSAGSAPTPTPSRAACACSSEIRATRTYDVTTLSVALREARNLLRAGT